MSDILARINRDKRLEVDARLGHMAESDLLKGPRDERVPLDFIGALAGGGLSVIAEVKKASPSKGLIRKDFFPLEFARSYARQGAACLSVLTEENYFQGHADYLKAIRAVVQLPILRKDFMVDPRQIRESYEMGADAVLLICASLSQKQLDYFHRLALSFGLSVLVEVHDEEEQDRALEVGAKLIGVNNRNLKTFETSLDTSLRLAPRFPEGVIRVSESGIGNAKDCQTLYAAGYHAVLVGEVLMRAQDPGSLIPSLVEGL